MPRKFLANLVDGDAVEEVYLVADKQLRANRNGNSYLQVDLADRTATLNARLWNAGEPVFRSFEVGDFVLARGKVQLFQGSLQIILASITRQEGDRNDLADFLPHTTQDIDKLTEKLRLHLRKISDPHLRSLADCFLMDEEFMRAFRAVPAGVRQHHAYIGGLLEHVVNMLDAVNSIAQFYPGVDRDLLTIGVFLHDAGKVRELTYDRAFSYTDEGQLLGHLVIGVELVTEKAAKVPHLTGEPFPKELLYRVKHMIVSHHGTLEFGSPRLPMTPEAIALHQLDNLDAKVHTFVRDIRADQNGGSAWTPFNAALQRRLYKGAPAGQESAGVPDESD